MPIKTGDTFIADNSDYYVIDTSGAEGNPIRGIYHSANAWTELQFGALSVDSYLQDGAVVHPHMKANSIISIPKVDGADVVKRTFYQSLIDASDTPDFSSGTTLGGVSVDNMSYGWQMRKHFHEFAMQFDKYPPIDVNHFNQYPEEYLFCVWRQDKKEFQVLKVGDIIGGIIGDGQSELVDNGVFTEFDFNPSNEEYWPSNNNPTDLNGDGGTSTADLLIFLTEFGSINDPNSTPYAGYSKSIIRITLPESDDDNPRFQVNKYVEGEDGSSNLIPSSDINLDNWIDNASLDHVYEPGHPLTIPVDAFFSLPEAGDLTIDSTDAFGVSQASINRPSTGDYSELDFDQYDPLDTIGIDNIHKSGLYTNLNKYVILKARITAYTTMPDVLHMHTYARYTRGLYNFPVKSCTRGEGGVTDIGVSGTTSFDIDRVKFDGEDAPQNHRSWQIAAQQQGDTRWVACVIGLPFFDYLGVGQEVQYMDWNYYTNAMGIQDPVIGPYISNFGLLRMLGGEHDTQDIKISFGFFSEYGIIDEVKVHELKIVLAPNPGGNVFED